MSEIQYSAVNVNAKALEEQREEIKKPKVNQNQGKVSFDPRNYLDLQLKEHENSKKVQVRLLPISPTDGRIFLEFITHALKVDKEIAKSGFKTYVCLNDEKVANEEGCPICKKSNELFEHAKQLRNEGNEALSLSIFKQASSLKKKKTFIVRVIDRAHEDEGVKFWRFNENSKGEGIYDKLMSLYDIRNQESIKDGDGEYNIFDLYNGKDIIIDVTKSKISDGHGGTKDSISYNITDSGNRKPLSKDVELANSWLNDTKTWKDVYSNKSYEYLELVVNGKIPVFNKEMNKYVEKTENDAAEKKAAQEAATEVLKANYRPTTVTDSEDITNNEGNSNDTADDLPF